MPAGIHSLLTSLDGAILVGAPVLLTFVALLLRSRIGAVEHFWRPAGLPWPVVALSLARSEFGALVWVAVPGLVLSREGDLRYLVWGVGALIARFAVNRWIVDAVHGAREGGPFALIDRHLGPVPGRFARVLVLLLAGAGALVGGGLALAPLAVVLPLPPLLLLAAALALAALWTMAGGVRSVVWTDALVTLSTIGLFAAILLRAEVPFRIDPAGAMTALRFAEQFDGTLVDKLRVLDFDPATGWRFTFWVAVLAVPFAQAALLGADPRQTLRWMACATPRAAKRAILAGFLGQFLVLGFLAIGCHLFLDYRAHPPTDPVILRMLDWQAGLPTRGDLALPVWILTGMPEVWRGALLAVLLLLAISAFTPALLACAAAFPGICSGLRQVRLGVGGASLFLGLAAGVVWRAMASGRVQDPAGLVLAPVDYCAGPLLGLVFAAASRHGFSSRGLLAGAFLALVCTAWIRQDWLPAAPPSALWAPWMWPLGTALTLFAGKVLARSKVMKD